MPTHLYGKVTMVSECRSVYGIQDIIQWRTVMNRVIHLLFLIRRWIL